MRKAKRLIALLTVAMFLFTFAAPVSAASFSDVTGDSSKDIYRLNALGIINGYPDGTFKPASQITRAEYAVIAMSAAGLANSADVLKNSPSKFKDVKAGDWYAGWVNLAASQGYIAGYPDGTFKPNANITNAECITILMRILGYDANLAGVWPTEYIVKAAELGVTDDVKVNASAAATRGDIAVLTSATLDEDLVAWDKDKDVFANKYDAAMTLLADKFEAVEYDEEGLIVTGWDMEDGQFVITTTSINGDDPTTAAEENNDFGTNDYTLAEDFVINGASGPTALSNHQIEIMQNDDDEITYINVTSKKVSAVKEDVAIDGEKLEVKDVKYAYSDDYVVNQAALVAIDQAYYTVCLDADGEIYKITTQNTSGTPKLVDEYNATTEKISYKTGGTTELKDKDVYIQKDGKAAKAADIKENDVVYVTAKTSLDYYIDVKTIKDSGEVEATYDAVAPEVTPEVKIAGTKYDVDAAAVMSTDGGEDFDIDLDAATDLDKVYGLDVKYFLDKKGDVAFIMSDKDSESNILYGMVTEVVSENLLGIATAIKVLKPDNTEVQYSVDIDEIEIDWASGIVGDKNPADDVTLPADLDTIGVSYKLDADGKVTDLDLLTFTVGALDDAVKDSNKIQIAGSWYYLDDNTKIINGNGVDDATVETNANLLKHVEDAAAPANIDAWTKFSGNKVEYIILNTAVAGVADDKAMVIDKYFKDGDLWIDVDVRGTTQSYEAVSTENFAGVTLDTLVAYTMSGAKIDLGAAVAGLTTSEIYDLDSIHESVEVSNGIYLEVDADTYIYDMTGDDPEFIGFEDLAEGDNIQYLAVVGDADRVGVIDVLFVVD